MKKTIFLLAMVNYGLITMSQVNNYYGSAIIPKNEYTIKLTDSNLLWSKLSENNNITLGTSTNLKVMFVPASNGLYFIKTINDGNYLTCKGSSLITSQPIRNENQKFKVVDKGKGKFAIISTNGFKVAYNNNIVCLQKNTTDKTISFEFLESKTKKSLIINK